MTSKIQALLAAVVTALAGVINWLVTVPPEQQSGMLAEMVNLFPVEQRPAIGMWTRGFIFFLGIYATYKASHSGPQTPPKNPPTE